MSDEEDPKNPSKVRGGSKGVLTASKAKGESKLPYLENTSLFLFKVIVLICASLPLAASSSWFVICPKFFFLLLHIYLASPHFCLRSLLELALYCSINGRGVNILLAPRPGPLIIPMD